MPIWLKRILRKAYTHEDLLTFAGGMLRKPPMPPDILISLHGIHSRDGESLVDYWRRYMSSNLENVSSAPTHRLQCEKLVRAILVENGWINTHVVVEKARHIGAWAHFIEDTVVGQGSSPEQLLFQRYLIALLTASCLTVVGESLYGFPDTQDLGFRIYDSYDREVRGMDVSIMDMLLDTVDSNDEVAAAQMATIKDDVINPLLKEQYATLAWIGDQIVAQSLDATAIQAQVAQLATKRQAVQALLSSSDPA